MLRKTLLSLGAAAFIATGAMGSALAGSYQDSPGIHVKIKYSKHHRHKVCKPIYKKVRWYDKYGHRHIRIKIVGYHCWWVKRHHHDDYDDHDHHEKHHDNSGY